LLCAAFQAAQKAKEMAEQVAADQAAMAAKAKAERAAADMRKLNKLSAEDRVEAEIGAAQKHLEARNAMLQVEATRIAVLEEQQRKGDQYCACLTRNVVTLAILSFV
jgi:hypothetical protein